MTVLATAERAGCCLSICRRFAAVIADEGAGVGAVRSETPDGLFVVGDAPASGAKARLGGPFLVSAAGLVASLAEVPSIRCDADSSAGDGVALGGDGGIAGIRPGKLVDATCSSAGTFGRAM